MTDQDFAGVDDDEKHRALTPVRKGAQLRALKVDPADVQRMTSGYESRLARQAEIITRLIRQLEQRTADVAEQMRRADFEAGVVGDHIGLQPYRVVREVEGFPYEDADPGMLARGDLAILDRLDGLIPKDWDWGREGVSREDRIFDYVRWLQDRIDTGEVKHRIVIRDLEQGLKTMQQERDQARADAKNNAKVANQAMAAVTVDADETPPWEKPGYTPPTVVGATMGRDTTLDDPRHPAEQADSETVSFGGFVKAMPAGEDRPGGF